MTNSKGGRSIFIAVAIVMACACACHTAFSQVRPLSNDRLSMEADKRASSGQSPVYAIGKAPIFGGDVAAARRVALQAAYAEAVATGTGISVGSLTIIRNVQQVSDLVTTRSRGVIRSYEVISESIGEENGRPLLTISIEAEVIPDVPSGDEELDALKLFLEILGQPRILVIAPQYEATLGRPGTGSSNEIQGISYRGPDGEILDIRREGTGAARAPSDYSGSPRADLPDGVLRGTEAALAQQLGTMGYRTTTLDMLAGQVDPDLLQKAATGNSTAALQVARQIGASVVLNGSFTVAGRRINPHGVEFEQVTVEHSSRALLSSSGEEVRTFFKSTTVAHSNMLAAAGQATARIAAEVADEVAWEIPRVLADSPHVLTIELEGLDFRNAVAASEELKRLDGVLDSRLIRLPAEDGTSAVIELRTGFVRLPSAHVFQSLQSHLSQPIRILSSDEFHLLLSTRS